MSVRLVPVSGRVSVVTGAASDIPPGSAGDLYDGSDVTFSGTHIESAGIVTGANDVDWTFTPFSGRIASVSIVVRCSLTQITLPPMPGTGTIRPRMAGQYVAVAQALGASPTLIVWTFPVNPITGGGWWDAELNGYAIGWRHELATGGGGLNLVDGYNQEFYVLVEPLAGAERRFVAGALPGDSASAGPRVARYVAGENAGGGSFACGPRSANMTAGAAREVFVEND